MLSLLLEAVMMAEETKGPMNADVLPICRTKVRFKFPIRARRANRTYHGEESEEQEPSSKFLVTPYFSVSGNDGRRTYIWGKGDTSLIIV